MHLFYFISSNSLEHYFSVRFHNYIDDWLILASGLSRLGSQSRSEVTPENKSTEKCVIAKAKVSFSGSFQSRVTGPSIIADYWVSVGPAPYETISVAHTLKHKLMADFIDLNYL